MTSRVPVLVSAPVRKPVTLVDLKAYLKVDFDDEDVLIETLLDAAIAHLDGFDSVLGRAIMPQTWKVYVPAGCTYIIPMPDISAARATYDDGSSADLVLSSSRGECTVEVASAGWVEFDCAMPKDKLPAVSVAIKQLVGHWFLNREATIRDTMSTPLSADMLISANRWGMV